VLCPLDEKVDTEDVGKELVAGQTVTWTVSVLVARTVLGSRLTGVVDGIDVAAWLIELKDETDRTDAVVGARDVVAGSIDTTADGTDVVAGGTGRATDLLESTAAIGGVDAVVEETGIAIDLLESIAGIGGIEVVVGRVGGTDVAVGSADVVGA
jgi:hypothetical protein